MARTTRAPIREAEVRSEPVREDTRGEPKKKVRARKGSNVNEFHIPPHMIPEGIDLQWNTDSVLGKPEPHMRSTMAQQAWEPVTGDMWGGRFDGMFMKKGHQGEINVGGLVLEWRPIELTMEARAEELSAARHARRTEERKMVTGAVEGVDPNFMDHSDRGGVARANTFVKREFGRVPSMPIAD